MISNTTISFLAILLLCSQAITASGRVGGGVDCLPSEVLADQLWNCDEAVAGSQGHHEVEFVAKKASTEIREKMDKVGASLPIIGNRKLMTTQRGNQEQRYYSIAEDLQDILIETAACLDEPPMGEWQPCMDGWNSDYQYTPCEGGLVCAKQGDHYAQCVEPTRKRHVIPVSVVVCGDEKKSSSSDRDPSTPIVEATQEEEESERAQKRGPAPAPEPAEGDQKKVIQKDIKVVEGAVVGAAQPPTPAEDDEEGQQSGGFGQKSSGGKLSGEGEPEPSDSDAPQPSDGAAPEPSDSDAPEPSDEDALAPSDEDAPAPPDGDASDLSAASEPAGGADNMADSPSAAAPQTVAAPIGDGRSTTGLAEEKCPSENKWNIKDWNLEEFIGKNFLFYEAQQSGELPAGHRVRWRGDSYLHDKHKDRLLNRGWFDAGDHLKLMFPMGWTLSTMAWGIIDGKEMLKKQQFDGASNLKWAVGTLEYGLEFLLDCSFDNGEFVAQVGNKAADHSNFFRAELDDVTPRTDGNTTDTTGVFFTLPPDRPGGDLLFQSAAAYAAGAMALRTGGGSETLAQRADKKAKELFKQAEANPGIYSDVIAESALTYKSDNWQQYGFLAAAWLYRMTGSEEYKTKADKYMEGAQSKQYWADYSWGSVYFGACAVMWQATDEGRYEEKLAMFAHKWVNGLDIAHTNKGLAYILPWGPLRHAVGGAGILAAYARGLEGKASSQGQSPEEIMAFAEHQVTYALGASGHSWVVGYGCNPPVNPHHRDSALTMEESNDVQAWTNRKVNANSLVGALVGGPDENDVGNDDRQDYRLNEVALDYNAAMFFGTVQVGR